MSSVSNSTHCDAREDSAPKQPTQRDTTGDASPSGEATELPDPSTQEHYRQEYLRQIRQRSCPGCGDEGIL